MGTNYYLQEKPPCGECGREFERLHIGKSSAGWCFALHVIPELGINDFPDWVARWSKPGAIITDEYDRVVEPAVMRNTIVDRVPRTITLNSDIPNSGTNLCYGLIRHKIDRYCTGHGDGTYDFIVGEFS